MISRNLPCRRLSTTNINLQVSITCIYGTWNFLRTRHSFASHPMERLLFAGHLFLPLFFLGVHSVFREDEKGTSSYKTGKKKPRIHFLFVVISLNGLIICLTDNDPNKEKNKC